MTGDPGNRLALALCRLACPVKVDCAAAEEAPHGVIRAGAVYAAGRHPRVVVPLCACGRPVAPAGVESGRCWQCAPPAPRIRLRRPGRPRRQFVAVAPGAAVVDVSCVELPHAA